MSPDAKREAVVQAIRRAIESMMLATEKKKPTTTAALRDGLHALSACRSGRRTLKESVIPRRRKKQQAA